MSAQNASRDYGASITTYRNTQNNIMESDYCIIIQINIPLVVDGVWGEFGNEIGNS